MYAIVKIGCGQYKVSPGDVIQIPLIKDEVGSQVNFSDVLLLQNDANEYQVGAPYLTGGNVVCQVMAHGKDKKIRVFKMKRRKNYRRTQGHRQGFTRVSVVQIDS